MRKLLLLLLLFLVGCIGSGEVEEVQDVVEDEVEIVEEEEIGGYQLDFYKQEVGMRVNIVRVEETEDKDEVKFTLVVEEIIGREENRDPFQWFGNLHSDSGKVFSLYQCGVERILENKWHASYCENFNVLERRMFEDDLDFIFTKQVNDDLRGKFIRDIDKLPFTIIIEMDLSDKDIGKN